MKYLKAHAAFKDLSPAESRKLEYFYEAFVLTQYEEYGMGHFVLACYTALPAVLTPDLTHKLWLNFKNYELGGAPSVIHPVAPADILLSSLVEEIGFELYEISDSIRKALLCFAKDETSQPTAQAFRFSHTLNDVAEFLRDYSTYDFTPANPDDNAFREAQQWTAMSYLEPGRAFGKVVQAFQQASKAKNKAGEARYKDAIEKMSDRFTLNIVKNGAEIPKAFKAVTALTSVVRDMLKNKAPKKLEEFKQEALQNENMLTDAPVEADNVINIDVPEAIGKMIEGDLSTKKKETRTLRALIVGVGPQAASSAADNQAHANSATLLSETLTKLVPGEKEITQLLHEQTTKQNILRTWKKLVNEAGENDDLLFYLAANAEKVEGHCHVICYDNLAESQGNFGYLTDAEIGEIAKGARCASITIVLQFDHAASPYWLSNLSNPKHCVFASSKYEQAATRFIVDAEGGPVCAFTYALVQTLKQKGIEQTNRELFADALLRYQQLEWKDNPAKTTGVNWLLKAPQLLFHPDAYERFFLQGKNYTVELQNQLRLTGLLDERTTGRWNEATAKALKEFCTEATLSLTLSKQEYIEQLTKQREKKRENTLPVFLLIFSDPQQKLKQLEREKRLIMQPLKGLESRLIVQRLDTPDKQTLIDTLQAKENRNRIELLYYSGFDDKGNFVLRNGSLTIFDLATLLTYQENLKLLVSNTCNSAYFADYCSQLGMRLSVGAEAKIDDSIGAKFGEMLFQSIADSEAINDFMHNFAEEFLFEENLNSFQLFKAPWFTDADKPLWKWKETPSSKSQQSSIKRKLWAIVAGVSWFEHREGRGLEACADNALKLARFLEDHCPSLGMDLFLLTIPSEGAMYRKEVMEALQQFSNAAEGDTCLFFFSGAATATPGAESFLDVVFSDDSPFFTPQLPAVLESVSQSLMQKNVPLVVITDFHEVVNIGQNLAQIHLPGPAVLLQNCRLNELAGTTRATEQPGASNNFFDSLLELLNEGGALLTYRSLIARLRLRIARRDWQHKPVLAVASPSELLDYVFLTRQPRQQRQYLVTYNFDLESWVVNAGAIHGIRPSLTFMKTLFKLRKDEIVSAKNVHIRLGDGFRSGEDKIASVAEVFSDYSVIHELLNDNSTTSLGEHDATYLAELLQNALPKIVMAFHPKMNREKKQELLNAVERYEIFFIDLSNETARSKYIINNFEDAYYLTHAFAYAPDDKETTPKPVFDFQRDPFEFIKQMEYIAKWQGVLEMDTHDVAMARDAVKISFEIVEGVSITASNLDSLDSMPGIKILNPEEVFLNYQRVNGQWSQPAFRVSIALNNESLRECYVGALFFSSTYGIKQVSIGTPNGILFKGGHPLDLTWDYRGRSYKTMPVKFEKEYFENNVFEVYDYLKLFISEEPINFTELTQDALEFGVGERVRGTGPKTEQGTFITPASDWATITVPIKIRHKKVYRGYVSAEEAKVLESPDENAKPVTILKHGQSVEVVEKQGHWYGIGMHEWVGAAFIRLEDDVEKEEPKEDFPTTVKRLYETKQITIWDDLQKHRWGGQNSRNGLTLTADVARAIIPGFYTIRASVSSTNAGRPLEGQVAFFKHDSFTDEIEYVEAKDGVATLKINFCYEAFTLGAYTDDGTELELDLNEVEGCPDGFYWKDKSSFKERVNEIYASKKVFVKDDLQKGRWGGKNIAKGKSLTTVVTDSLIPGFYNVHFELKSSSGHPLQGEVAFFLHDSFGREIRFVQAKDGIAELKVKSYEAFTVGAYTEDSTELELDLNNVPGLPERFYYETTKENNQTEEPYWLETTKALQGESVRYNDTEEHFGPFVTTRGIHELSLPASFKLSKYLVTNEFFYEFVRDGGYEDKQYWDGNLRKTFLCQDKTTFGPASWPSFAAYPSELAQHPVSGISYFETQAFFNWLNRKHPLEQGWQWGLPTEDMWEYVARTKEGFLYPWGFEFDQGRCNSTESGLNATSSVFAYENGKSKDGCFDMAGNVWEFMESNNSTESRCILRGGSYKNNRQEVRSHLCLFGVSPNLRPLDFGFRCSQVYHPITL